METNLNITGAKDLFITDWKDFHVELLRLDYKKSGLFTYLPKSIVEFLNLNKKEDRSLVALLDSEGEHNYVILVADKSLVELVRPIILARREKAQQLQQELKMKLQVQRQQATEAEQDAVSIDV